MKKALIVLMSFAMLFTCACGSKTKEVEKQKDERKVQENQEKQEEVVPEPDSTFEVAKEIYSGQGLSVICKEITKEDVIFEISNQTKREILFSFDIGLDGILVGGWSDASESTVPAGQTIVVPYHCGESLDYAEHKTLSASVIGFVDQTEYLSFDVVDFDLGGESHPEDLASGQVAYSDDTIEVQFIELFAEGIRFKVKNSNAFGYSVFMNDIKLNGDIDGGGSAFTIPPHTEGLCDYYATNYVPDMNGDSINSFDIAFMTRDNNGSNEKRFNVHYENGKITGK